MNSRNRINLFSILFLSVTLAPGVSLAANHYVRAGAAGSGNGSDWTNAYPSLPATLVRGDTYYVAGGSYPSYTFDDAVSGTSIITIKKATASDHGIETGWQDTYGTAQASFPGLIFKTGYYNFDGVTGGGPGAWETGLGFKVKSTYHTIDFIATVSNVTIAHTDIEGGGRTEASDTDNIYLVNPYTNITVSHCFLHDVSRTMILSWPSGGSGLTIEYSKFARNGTAEHREAWSAGTDSNVIVRYNLFEDILGTGFIAIVNSNGTAANWDIYGNVFYWTGKYTDGIINTGVIMNRYDGSSGPISVRASNWHIYNNIIANIRGGSFTAAIAPEGPLDTYVVENNIWYNNVGGAGATGTLVDYNWYYANGSNGASGAHDIVGSASPFADVQPWLTGNWKLKAEIPGIALASPYNQDPLGTIRGEDGVFDRGAYEYGSGSAPAPSPTPTSTSTATPSPAPSPTPISGGQSLLSNVAGPVDLVSRDGVEYELGMRFTSSAAGQIKAIRFYKSASESGTHTGKIYSSSGALLASVVFSSESAEGWQQADLATALNITANTEYTVSVNTGNQYYVDTTSGLASQVVNGNLMSVVGCNGVYGSVGARPTNCYSDTNYYRDVVFVASTSPSPSPSPTATATAPSITSFTAASTSITSGQSTTLSWSVSGASSLTLNPGALNVTGATSKSVTPTATTTYTLTATNSAGSVSKSVTITVTAATISQSLFTSQTPATLKNNDGVNYELGMRFKATAAGKITAIRFYKSSSESGTHTGKIYSSTGTLLASVVFSGETASGWQTMKLSTPLSIAANTEYTVSVNTGNKYYVDTVSGMASQITNGNLMSIVGNNGVYGPVGSRPTSSWSNSNYFRDVVFAPN